MGVGRMRTDETVPGPGRQGRPPEGSSSVPVLYRIGRWIIRAALGFYFSRIERFHLDRVPATGPVLFTSNHPNSLTDPFVIGTSVARKLNFVATVQLFRIGAVRWVLTHCGVIPINRVKDDPRGMRSVRDTFEACFRVLENGEAIGIFPEGITHDDPQLKSVKTGAARMALELEARHEGSLGLRVMPVGLTFSAKERYRSEALVNFGEPLRVTDFLAAYQANRHAGIQALSAEIEHRIQELILHLPRLERARLVEAVKRLYLERLWVGNTVVHEPVSPQAGELLLTQSIGRAIDEGFEKRPERAREFVFRLGRYEAALRRLRLPEEVLARFPEPRWMLRQSLWYSALAVLGAPIALYGWVHRAVPYFLLRMVIRRAGADRAGKSHISTAAILGGIALFTAFYGACVLVFHQFFGLRATVLYACSLPAAGLIAHYYARELRRFGAGIRAAAVLLRAPSSARRLLA